MRRGTCTCTMLGTLDGYQDAFATDPARFIITQSLRAMREWPNSQWNHRRALQRSSAPSNCHLISLPIPGLSDVGTHIYYSSSRQLRVFWYYSFVRQSSSPSESGDTFRSSTHLLDGSRSLDEAIANLSQPHELMSLPV